MAVASGTPLLALLLRRALLARVLVGALQRFGRREAAQTRRQRRVLLDVDRQLEEVLQYVPTYYISNTTHYMT